MTRKDYIFIAKIIKDNTSINGDTITKVNKGALIVDLCEMFKDDNNLFNSDRFIKACE